jgi:hypothetical protein
LTAKIKTSLGYIKQYFSAQQKVVKVQIKEEEARMTVNQEHTISQSDGFTTMSEISRSKKYFLDTGTVYKTKKIFYPLHGSNKII